MERLISDEERIRRAEDILERRRNSNIRFSNDEDDKQKNSSRGTRLCLQILVCLCIYCGFYYLKNSQNENFRNVIGTIKNTLEYDVNFKQIYDNMCIEVQKFNLKIKNPADENNEEEINEVVQENIESEEENKSPEDTNINAEEQNKENENLGIGGESDEAIASEPISYELQMQMDAEYIKQKLNLINPLEDGVVTSKFGSREASSVVSANHKGIDLGAATGSVIVAAADGKVIEASSEGDFGIHLKIENEDVVLIYGHCSEILVKEGDYICKGQEIAKVGATGKATGPHLHFEVRRDSRAVDPQMILNFN